ncbi:MAG TPA: hypothetical protein VEC57_05540 [Candidatus Limnocylindrales bacterium]|nr:hypothetical protein [Candidatus Limnocylindrales bacterium]
MKKLLAAIVAAFALVMVEMPTDAEAHGWRHRRPRVVSYYRVPRYRHYYRPAPVYYRPAPVIHYAPRPVFGVSFYAR